MDQSYGYNSKNAKKSHLVKSGRDIKKTKMSQNFVFYNLEVVLVVACQTNQNQTVEPDNLVRLATPASSASYSNQSSPAIHYN